MSVILTRSHWPADRSVEIVDMTVGQLLLDAAEAAPGNIALIDGSAAGRRRWTYAQLREAAVATAYELTKQYSPGERLAIWGPSCPEWEIFEFAAALAGITVVTVNPAYRRSELGYVLGQSKCVGLAMVQGHRGADFDAILNDVRDGLPDLRTVHYLSDWTLSPAPPPTWTLPSVDASGPAMIHYTSGTTGAPKGAVLSHRSLTNNARLFARRFGIAAGSVWADAFPMFHLSGSGFCAMGAMWTRSAHLIFPFDPELALRIIEEERAAFFPAVPTMLLSMLEHPTFETTDLSSLDVVMSGGTTIPQSLVQQVETRFGARFGAVYGQTELSGVICQSHPTDSYFDKSQRAGQPLEQVEVKIIDAGQSVVACGQVGEILVRGFNVMLGYFDDPERTKATLTDDGWLHTGDLGTMDTRGYIQVTGRLKDVIIRGGENIYPREIEDRLQLSPSVADVSVVGVPDERWGEQVAAFVRPVPGTTPTAQELTDFLQDLTGYKIPRIWLQVDELPLTSSGKVQKFVLREGYDAGLYKALD